MKSGHFYFINAQYYIDFQDDNLMKDLKRPGFYAIEDKSTGIFWLIPFSSRTEKYHKIYDSKVERNGICDTIVFGEVLGREKAFLIQNMCPVTEKYIANEYIDRRTNLPVRIDGALEQELIKKAARVLALQRRGKKLIFPDVLSIEKSLIEK